MVDVRAALAGRFPRAQIADWVQPADGADEEVHWLRLDRGARKTLFVGVAKRALEHRQNLVAQLDEYLDFIAPDSSATLVLRDHSDLQRYQLA